MPIEPEPVEIYSPERMAAIARKESEDAVHRHQAGLFLDIVLAQRKALRPVELATLCSALLSRVGTAHAREAVSRCMVDTLLRQDDIDLCTVCFPTQALNGWVITNTDFAFASCPKTIHAWLAGGAFGSALVLSNIARACHDAHDDEKQAILEGKAHNPLHRMVPFFLREALAPWSVLSPSWIGPDRSELRERIIAMGWSPRLLMGMIFSSIWQQPDAWLGNVRYPYSIVVCKWILDVMRNGPLRSGRDEYFVNTLAVSPNACPRDAALAAGLLRNSPVPIVYTLSAHPELARVDEQTNGMIAAVVNLRATHHGMPSLAQDICEGTVLGGDAEEFGIDELV